MKAGLNTVSNAKAVVDLFIYAQGAEASSSLGIVLGNFGLNMSQFCTDFNKFTQALPTYFLLKVRIVIFENRTFGYSVILASLGYYLRLLSEEVNLTRFVRRQKIISTISVISLDDFFVLFRLKFPYKALPNILPIAMGVLANCHIKLKSSYVV